MIDDESLVKTRTNTCLSYASAIPSYSVNTASRNVYFEFFKYRVSSGFYSHARAAGKIGQ